MSTGERSNAANAPRVSVIMPFLNAARFIDDAIRSVFAQSYQDWELLLCDDGSTDGSSEVARQWARQHPGRLLYLQHEGHRNRGSSATRNLGFRHAGGTYIALLDADDVWEREKLFEQVHLMERHPRAGMLYGDTLHWYGWTGTRLDALRDYRQPLGVPINALSEPPTVLIRYLQGKGAVACTCSVLARRDVVLAVGGFEESFAGMYDDQAFYAKLLLAAPIYVSDRVWAKYRKHPDSMCTVAGQTREEEAAHLRYLAWLEQYLRERGVTHRALWRALRAEQWRTRHPVWTRLYRAAQLRLRAVIPGSNPERLPGTQPTP